MSWKDKAKRILSAGIELSEQERAAVEDVADSSPYEPYYMVKGILERLDPGKPVDGD